LHFALLCIKLKPRALKSHIVKIVLLSLSIKLAYHVFSLVVLAPNKDLGVNAYVNTMQRNDAAWYKSIAENGYPKLIDKKQLGYVEADSTLQSAWAFFPLYPAIVKAPMLLFHVSFGTSAFLWSSVLSTLALLGFYFFARKFLDSDQLAFFATTVFAVFPFHYYLSVFYTEALFFSLLIFAFIGINNGKWFLFTIVLFLLCLTRPNGIVAILPLFFYYLEKQGVLIGFRLNWKSLINWKNIGISCLFLAGPLALVLYGMYQYQMTGNYMAFGAAQAGWGRRFMFPFMAFFREGDVRMQFNSVYTILVMVYVIYFARKMPLSFQLLVWIGLLLPLTAGSVVSMPRFISMLFPLILLAVYNWPPKLKYQPFIVAALFLLQLGTFYFWVVGDWFSY